MNAAGLRRCVEDKEALAAAYNDLSNRSAKECALYERDLERAMESCDDLARENEQLRSRLQQDATVSTFSFISNHYCIYIPDSSAILSNHLEALTAQVQDLQKHNEALKINLNKAEAEVDKLCDDNRVLDEENKRLLCRLEKERQRRSERKQSGSTSTKNKRKSSSLKDGTPVGRAIDFSPVGADSSRHPLSPLPHNSPDYRAHKK
ncbi:hypothetical protein PR202_ga03488 [Eleusine coracana subsp. coracana]|uniref:Uncharacterized protein n=1 Tax=Eleusine coracana subsp. coracana TaxID=191504 RepID=A0AAV5BM85_ELECO|nr:hypothetical protein PR202_ga03488 [Eleusine coracana subsp. coracana]